MTRRSIPCLTVLLRKLTTCSETTGVNLIETILPEVIVGTEIGVFVGDGVGYPRSRFGPSQMDPKSGDTSQESVFRMSTDGVNPKT